MIKVTGLGSTEDRLRKLEQSVNFSPMIMGIAAVHGDGGSSGSVTSIAGGVGITNSPEPIIATGTVDLDINSLTTETASASGDLFPFVDVSVGTAVADQRKITRANILGTTLETLRGITLGTGIATWLATPSSANLATAMTDETGTGALVFANTPTLVTPVLGTPTSGTLTNCTGLPVATGISGLGANVAAWLATPSSANLRSVLTDETGTGAAVFADTPTLVTPLLGTPTSGTLTNCTGLPISTGVSGLGSGVAAFLATPTSANFAAAVTGETGTGGVVFDTSPTIVTPTIASFANATHSHQNAAGGGTLDHGLALTGLSDDDHTQYLLLAGRSGGQTANGGTATTDSLTLNANDETFALANTGRIVFGERGTFAPSASTSSALSDAFLTHTGTLTTSANSFVYSGFDFKPTINYSTSLSIAISPAFWARPTFQPTASVADTATTVTLAGFFGNPFWKPNAASITPTTPAVVGFLSTPSAAVTTGTSGTIANLTAYASFADNTYNALTLFAPTVGANITATTVRGLHHGDPNKAASGTITNQVAVDIEALTQGGTLIAGVRSAIASGTGKWFLLGTGSADSSLGGRLFVGNTGSTVPNTDLDVDGDFATRMAGITLSNGANNDIAIGARSFVRITGPTAGFSTSGFASPFDGKRLVVINTVSQVWTITNDATSTAANRILTGTGADIVLNSGIAIAEFIYDATSSRWRLLSVRDDTGGIAGN